MEPRGGVSANRQGVRPPSLGKTRPGLACIVVLVSRGLFGQDAPERLSSLFGCLRHAFKKAGRAFYRPLTTGTVNRPPPRLRSSPASLHDERIVGRVKFSAHAS